jgi:hypothetical protein
MPDELTDIIASLPIRLRKTMKAAVHAHRNYRAPSDHDIARDTGKSARTIRRHRKTMGLPPLRSPGRYHKPAA